jgi:ABC-type lipoprotein release transport system permease subunit
VGFGVAWLMSTSMSHLIVSIAPRDTLTFTVSSVLLIAVTTASSFAPLTRIAKLDPVVLLRAE